MKKITILAAMMFVIIIAHAQKQNYQSAWSSFNKGYLDKAKDYIDLAVQDPDTKTWAKTWKLKGDIYLNIQFSKDDKYKKLDSNAVMVAYNSYQKAIELDPKKEFYDEILASLLRCGDAFYNKGAEYFGKAKYLQAMNSFAKTIEINALIGNPDSLATFNAGVSAMNAKLNDKAKEYFIKDMKINYKNPALYYNLANIYKEEKNIPKALDVVKKGRKVFNDNTSLMEEEVNIYLAGGMMKETKGLLDTLIKISPNNPQLYFAFGGAYEAYANDTTKSRVDRDTSFNNAAKEYKKAIELKPDYFDAIYEIGALYFNDGIRLYLVADGMVNDMTKYNEMKTKFEERWKNALPYLEKAQQLSPNDKQTLISLKQLYARTSQMDKLKAVTDKLNSLK
ncbi:MAG: tetratricopeptide repeat protein [Bacteroidales bacterium]|jgi:tetratricopeptide (TPR) repeat protein